MDAPLRAIEAAEEAGLVYVHDTSPGITRKRTRDGFDYFGPKGDPIMDQAVLERIRSLAIPPAYEDVWICARADGHLQAVGKDARGRKQYRYHPEFRMARDEAKYERLAEFGRWLPKIQKRVQLDLSKRGFPREKVLAACVELLAKSFIRVGNEQYAKENHSFGLTTLRNKHVKVDGPDLTFEFLGKSRIRHRITLRDVRLARIVRGLQELPGQELFQYFDHDGRLHSISSHDVNAYLREITGQPFTAKDFRTWAGTVLAISELAGHEMPASQRELKTVVSSAIRNVAGQLRNTPTVCRKCYVHPAVLEAFATGRLNKLLSKGPVDFSNSDIAMGVVLTILKEADRSDTGQKRNRRGRRRAAA